MTNNIEFSKLPLFWGPVPEIKILLESLEHRRLKYPFVLGDGFCGLGGEGPGTTLHESKLQLLLLVWLLGTVSYCILCLVKNQISSRLTPFRVFVHGHVCSSRGRLIFWERTALKLPATSFVVAVAGYDEPRVLDELFLIRLTISI